jgi:hypothetical protein
VRIAEDWPLSDITRVSGRRPVLSLASLHLYLACLLRVRLPGPGPVILRSGGSCCPVLRNAPIAIRRWYPESLRKCRSASIRNKRSAWPKSLNCRCRNDSSLSQRADRLRTGSGLPQRWSEFDRTDTATEVRLRVHRPKVRTADNTGGATNDTPTSGLRAFAGARISRFHLEASKFAPDLRQEH